MQLPLGWLLCEAVLTMWLTFPLRNGELLIRVLLRLRKKLMFDASKVGLSVMKAGTRLNKHSKIRRGKSDMLPASQILNLCSMSSKRG
ncbi:hypothetical protein BCT81_10250 [Vibrio sp. 10N.261.52.A1]|nr:hypothetical protein VSWAT3_25919 [Vibrionales bacterium SWAT-3]PML53371.1 hypothetical protein BCT81_10250 [Vibrio sp. 10N.261.52.A1]